MNATYEQNFAFVNAIIFVANRLGFLDAYSIVKSNLRSQVIILMYHRVGTNKDVWSIDTIDASEFEKHMKYLLKTHKIISLEKIVHDIAEKKALPKRAAVVTFDDGYKDIYTNAFPILKKYNIPATIFLTTGHIGTNNLFWWDKIRYILCNTKQKSLYLEDLGDISPPSLINTSQSLYKIIERVRKISEEKKINLIKKLMKISDVDIPQYLGRDIILSWDEVKEMSENGIDFGSHTVTHPILTKLPLKQAKYEITKSKEDIQKRLCKPVTIFCYPNGTANDFNTKIIDLLKKSGFICGTSK